MSDVHDFSESVVAVLNRKPKVSDAISNLRAEGFEFEVLHGEEGRKHLDPEGEQSPVALVKRLINALGDEYRILDQLHSALDAGKYVVSVEAPSDRDARAIEILQDHGGEYLWKFGKWTFNRVGEEG